MPIARFSTHQGMANILMNKTTNCGGLNNIVHEEISIFHLEVIQNQIFKQSELTKISYNQFRDMANKETFYFTIDDNNYILCSELSAIIVGLFLEYHFAQRAISQISCLEEATRLKGWVLCTMVFNRDRLSRVIEEVD